ncbi:FtsX-like permease family protein [Brevibacterium casei]|nr:FtsX-like permease family protein [Brevibacterium casei]
MNPLNEIRSNPRQFIPSFLVVFVASLFGTAIVQGIGILTAWMNSSALISGSDTAQLLITLVGLTFFVIALFVSSIVISNTFSIIIAGRSRQLALLRLIGASAKRLRRAAGLEGLLVAAPSALAAFVASTGLAFGVLLLLGDEITAEAGVLSWTTFLPAILTVLVTWGAAYSGARRISTISPIEATSQSVERSPEDSGGSRKSLVSAIVLVAIGVVLLAGGAVLSIGVKTPLGLLIATLGGAVSFLGFVIGNAWFVPPLQSRIGRTLARGSSARLAAKNIERHPTRSARTVIGLVVGVTLIVMFATAMTTFRDQLVAYTASLDERGMGDASSEIMRVVDNTMLFFLGMVAFSVVIAVIGVANALMLSVRQRTKEIGLLMALGQTPRQVRQAVLSESAQLSVTACFIAIPLGIVYGWIGALTVLSELTGFFAPSIPWMVLLGVALGAGAAAILASRAPARAATRVSPIKALEAV